jgi:hypothetical protein
MACDPRQKTGAQENKSSFFRTLGKAGDIEALNSIDGNIGQGLRALETVSNQLRTGEGPVAEVWRSVETSIEAGADAVFETVSIDPNTARDIGNRFNPGVLNRAQGQAEQIYQRVRQGNFEIRDVPEAIQDFGNLSQLLSGVFTPKQNQDPGEPRAKSKICDPSPWATDLIHYAPKFKFMFVMEFIMSSQYIQDFIDLKTAFVVKRAQRPTVNFEYEDINYYNFRTKVVKRSEYQPLQLTFYDDMLGNALKFYNRYLQIISPISRGHGNRSTFEERGMSFDPDNISATASIGAVGDTAQTILRQINLYHIVNGGRQVDRYQFDSPRFQVITLDDLDMTDGSTGTEVTLEFNYDRLFIEPNLPINSDNYQGNITRASEGGEYQITFENLPADNGGDFGREPFSVRNDSGDDGLTEIEVTATPRREAILNSQNPAYTNEEQQRWADISDALGADGNTLGGVDQTPNISNQQVITPPTLPNFDG